MAIENKKDYEAIDFIIGSKVKSFKLEPDCDNKKFIGQAIFEKGSENAVFDIEMNKTNDCAVLSIVINGNDLLHFGKKESLGDYNKFNIYTEGGYFINVPDQELFEKVKRAEGVMKQLSKLHKYSDIVVNNDSIKLPEAGNGIKTYTSDGVAGFRIVTDKEAGSVRWAHTKWYQDLIYGQDFNNFQKEMIKYAIRNDLNYEQVNSFAKPEYNSEQMLEIIEGLLSGQSLKDIAIYNDPKKYNSFQMTEIRLGISHPEVMGSQYEYHHLSLEEVDLYARPDLDSEQMRCIRLSLEEGIDKSFVEIYAKPEFSADQMRTLRVIGRMDISLEQFKMIAKHGYKPEVMIVCAKDINRKNLEARFEKEKMKIMTMISRENDNYNLINTDNLPEEAQFELWAVLDKYKKKTFVVEGDINDYVCELDTFKVLSGELGKLKENTDRKETEKNERR